MIATASQIAAVTQDDAIRLSAGRPTQTGAFHGRLFAFLTLLLTEVGVLTPPVEFSNGSLVDVASAQGCSGFLLALAAFLVVVCRTSRRCTAENFSQAHPQAVCWLTANVGLYCVFFAYSLRLARPEPDLLPGSLQAPAWLLLGASVGITSLLSFFSRSALVQCLLEHRTTALVALALGTSYVLMTPNAQTAWPRVQAPAAALVRETLRNGRLAQAPRRHATRGPSSSERHDLLYSSPLDVPNLIRLSRSGSWAVRLPLHIGRRSGNYASGLPHFLGQRCFMCSSLFACMSSSCWASISHPRPVWDSLILGSVPCFL
jgi:hypothetical protein